MVSSSLLLIVNINKTQNNLENKHTNDSAKKNNRTKEIIIK